MFTEFSNENLSAEQRIDVDMNFKVYIGALFGGMADLPAITKLFDTNIAKYSKNQELNNPVVSKVNVTETVDAPVNDKTESKTESCKPVTQTVSAIKRVRSKRYNRHRPVCRSQRQTTQTPQVQHQPQYAPQVLQPQYQPQVQYAPQVFQPQYQPQVQYAPQVLQPQYQWCIVGYMPIYAHVPQF